MSINGTAHTARFIGRCQLASSRQAAGKENGKDVRSTTSTLCSLPNEQLSHGAHTAGSSKFRPVKGISSFADLQARKRCHRS